MKQWALGSLLGAIVMFVWGFIYWGTGAVDPFSHASGEGEAAVATALASSLPGAGVYFVPDMANGTVDEWVERHKAGPIAMVSFQSAGADPQSPTTMLAGFVHMLVTVGVLGAALLLAGLSGFADRFRLAAVIGVAATVFANLGDPIWFHAPWGFHLTVAIYDIVAWLVAGAVLAYFIKPRAAASTTQAPAAAE